MTGLCVVVVGLAGLCMALSLLCGSLWIRHHHLTEIVALQNAELDRRGEAFDAVIAGWQSTIDEWRAFSELRVDAETTRTLFGHGPAGDA